MFIWQIRMICKQQGFVLWAIFLSIDLFIKIFIYKEHENKPAQISAGCTTASELMRSTFMRALGCYFLYHNGACCKRGVLVLLWLVAYTIHAPLFLLRKTMSPAASSCHTAWDFGRSLSSGADNAMELWNVSTVSTKYLPCRKLKNDWCNVFQGQGNQWQDSHGFVSPDPGPLRKFANSWILSHVCWIHLFKVLLVFWCTLRFGNWDKEETEDRFHLPGEEWWSPQYK